MSAGGKEPLTLVLAALTPHLSAVLFGRYVLKMNPVNILLTAWGPVIVMFTR